MQTLTLIKADVGSNPGHWCPTDAVVAAVEETPAEGGDFLDDHVVFLMESHRFGIKKIHSRATGAMRGSHHGILYPVRSGGSEIPSYFDGPSLVTAIGMVVNDGQFSDPVYPFDATFWDSVMDDAARRFREFRERRGTFGPGTVEASELEYGGWTDIVEASKTSGRSAPRPVRRRTSRTPSPNWR